MMYASSYSSFKITKREYDSFLSRMELAGYKLVHNQVNDGLKRTGFSHVDVWVDDFFVEALDISGKKRYVLYLKFKKPF